MMFWNKKSQIPPELIGFNPYQFLRIAVQVMMKEILAEKSGKNLAEKYEFVVDYLQVWEEKFSGSSTGFKSITNDVRQSKKAEILKSANYLYGIVMQLGNDRDSVYELEKQIISEVVSICDDLHFADGDFYEVSANILVFNAARAVLVLNDSKRKERAHFVLGATLIVMYRFADYCEESYSD
jgi:hypothetical protein